VESSIQNPENSFADVKHTVAEILKEAQLLQVQNLGKEDERASINAVWSKIVKEVENIPIKVKESVKTLPSLFKQLFTKELKSDISHFSSRWEAVKQLLMATIQRASDLARNSTAASIQSIEEFETKYINKASDILKQEWKSIKQNILAKLDLLESHIHSDNAALKHKWDSFFVKHERHLAHRIHFPTLRCGACGKQYTLPEFLALVEDRGYMIKEEDWWTDEELEEFYEGWGVWANRSAIHCVQCEAEAWRNVEFVSEEEERILEREWIEGELSTLPRDEL